MSFFFDPESLNCQLSDLETGPEDHPDYITSFYKPISSTSDDYESSEVNYLQAELSSLLQQLLQAESDVQCIQGELDILFKQQMNNYGKRIEKGNALKRGDSIAVIHGKSKFEVQLEPGHRSVLEKKPQKETRKSLYDSSTGDILCIHSLNGLCLDPDCPFFHPSSS